MFICLVVSIGFISYISVIKYLKFFFAFTYNSVALQQLENVEIAEDRLEDKLWRIALLYVSTLISFLPLKEHWPVLNIVMHHRLNDPVTL